MCLMDKESLKTTAEVWGIRSRGWLFLAVQIFGLALVLLGALNILAPGLFLDVYGTSGALSSLPSLSPAVAFVVSGVGALLVWFA